MFFDGAVRMRPKEKIITGAMVVFISFENDVLSYAYSLMELCSNNVTKYNALIIGLQITEEMGVKYLECYGEIDSQSNQGEFDVRNEDLILYH